ncbi:MAG TPA: hydantoinase B/oxoprolinase family protein, partial [Thermoleophilaceae bacterium]|nr:hydantoinase B/oxoprolinase family protein [Thermoleophilaceae bacterium]
MTTDPITLATIWHSLQTTCREARHVIKRTAQSYLIGQAQDVSVGIWDARGNTVAVPTGLPVQFLGTRFAAQAILELFKDDLKPGDVILSNDPYHGGHNCHLPDWGFFRPVFYDGELAFFTLVRAHMQDTGGAYPGGYFPDGHDILAEGLCIPPLKIHDEGEPRQDLLDLIWNNVRWPEGMQLDSDALIAATRVMERRIVEVIDKYGPDTTLGCVDEMLDRTEAAVRSNIKAIPDGTYSAEASTDDDGTELDVPVTVRTDITIEGDEMTIDFSRSDEQRQGFVNCIYATTYGLSIGAAILFFDSSIADYHNEGSMRPVHVIAREGSVLNCRYPATVGASPVSVGSQVMETVMEALSKAVPNRSMASWGKHRGDYVFATDPRTGEPYLRTMFDYDGSAGGVWGFDGYSAVSTLCTLGALNRGTVEEHETRLPWKVLKWEFSTDHMGAGRWRGGPGMSWEAVNLGTDGHMVTGSSDGDVIEGFGIHGGHP